MFGATAALSYAQTVTFNEQIAPIIYGNCSKCHHPGEVAPFSLLSYDDVRSHARTIVTVTQSHYMPPWKPEPGWAAYRDERRLAPAQIALIQQWVAAGMPQGDPAKAPLAPQFTQKTYWSSLAVLHFGQIIVSPRYSTFGIQNFWPSTLTGFSPSEGSSLSLTPR